MRCDRVKFYDRTVLELSADGAVAQVITARDGKTVRVTPQHTEFAAYASSSSVFSFSFACGSHKGLLFLCRYVTAAQEFARYTFLSAEQRIAKRRHELLVQQTARYHLQRIELDRKRREFAHCTFMC